MTRKAQQRGVVQRLSMSSSAPDSPFVADTTPFFDRCEDGIMSLHAGGRMGLLDLFDWQVTDAFVEELKYITYVRPARSNGSATAGHLSNPCATPNGFEFGTATLTLQDFGRYGRSGPVRDILKPEKYCRTDPRYRLDGTVVASEFEWDLGLILDVLKQDLFRDIIVGNNSTAGKFDGLQQWINTGYDSAILDSYVVDWAGNDMDGDGGGTITINSNNATGTFDLVDLLLSIYRRFKQRISWSPQLATQGLRVGDVVLVLPTFLAECLLDKYTCWSVCPGKQYNEVNLNSLEARNYRNQLLGGLYGAGEITLDGDTIPLFTYDWETMHGSNRGDIYFMIRSVGNVRIWQGQHLSASVAANELRQEGHAEYFSTDGGRIIGKTAVENLCRQTSAWIRPRLWCRAPYLQARIMNVECQPVLDPLSPDPDATSWYPVTSFAADTATTG